MVWILNLSTKNSFSQRPPQKKSLIKETATQTYSWKWVQGSTSGPYWRGKKILDEKFNSEALSPIANLIEQSWTKHENHTPTQQSGAGDEDKPQQALSTLHPTVLWFNDAINAAGYQWQRAGRL